jgi:glutaconate CoA-transferase subunit A
MGYSTRDNSFYTAWDEISRDRDVFDWWIQDHIRGTEDHDSYLASIGRKTSDG